MRTIPFYFGELSQRFWLLPHAPLLTPRTPQPELYDMARANPSFVAYDACAPHG